MATKFILLDVANTLLHKPLLFERLKSSLDNFNYNIDFSELKVKHKLLSEVIKFPDKTSQEFYSYFNSELLYSLGIMPTSELLDAVFKNCTYLEWAPFNDTQALNEMNMPMGIASNWDSSLSEKLAKYFSINFRHLTVSSLEGNSKPSQEFYKKAIQNTGVAAEEIIYVGDSIKLDIEPASKLGVRSILIDRDHVYPSYKGEKIASFYELNRFIS